MIPTKSNPLKWALGGALIGAAMAASQIDHSWTGVEMIVGNLSEMLGGAAGGALIAGVVARIRNAMIK